MALRIITFIADKLSFKGPTVDGGFKVTLDVGEYNQDKISELLKIPQQTNIKVTIEYGEE